MLEEILYPAVNTYEGIIPSETTQMWFIREDASRRRRKRGKEKKQGGTWSGTGMNLHPQRDFERTRKGKCVVELGAYCRRHSFVAGVPYHSLELVLQNQSETKMKAMDPVVRNVCAHTLAYTQTHTCFMEFWVYIDSPNIQGPWIQGKSQTRKIQGQSASIMRTVNVGQEQSGLSPF